MKPHIETMPDGTQLATDRSLGKDIDPMSGYCAISVNGNWLLDKFGNKRRFRTFAAAKSAAIKTIKAAA